MKMRVGFYGPGEGMTQAQRQALFLVLSGLGSADMEAHHDGFMRGASGDFHKQARTLGWTVHIHPYVGHRPGVVADMLDIPAPPDVQRRRLVEASLMMVCTPAADEEDGHDATWTVIRMCNEKGLPLVVIWPDGGVRMERCG